MLVLEALTRIRWMELNEIKLVNISGPATLAGDKGTDSIYFQSILLKSLLTLFLNPIQPGTL